MYQFNNPYVYNPVQMNPPSQQIIKVNGENGARMYNLPPSSSTLLLDENNPIVFLIQTDGAGYKTVIPYEIKPYQPEAPVDIKSIDARLKRLEALINESNSTGNAETE